MIDPKILKLAMMPLLEPKSAYWRIKTSIDSQKTATTHTAMRIFMQKWSEIGYISTENISQN